MGWSHIELTECEHCESENCESWIMSEGGVLSSGTMCLDCGIESYPKVTYNRVSLDVINDNRVNCYELPPLKELTNVDGILEELVKRRP